MTDPPLMPLGHRIKAHLKEHRPTLAKQLEEAGTLDQTCASLQEVDAVAYDDARNSGLAPDQAREIARAGWAFPDEEDMPNLDLSEISSGAKPAPPR